MPKVPKKEISERDLLTLEAYFDRINRDSRKSLGIVRRVLGYHKKARQKCLQGWLDRPPWLKHQADYRPKKEEGIK